MTIYVPLLVAVIGAVLYLVMNHAKAAELGRCAFFAGLLVFLFGIAGRSVELLK